MCLTILVLICCRYSREKSAFVCWSVNTREIAGPVTMVFNQRNNFKTTSNLTNNDQVWLLALKNKRTSFLNHYFPVMFNVMLISKSV